MFIVLSAYYLFYFSLSFYTQLCFFQPEHYFWRTGFVSRFWCSLFRSTVRKYLYSNKNNHIHTYIVRVMIGGVEDQYLQGYEARSQEGVRSASLAQVCEPLTCVFVI
jgi:hypothetical protein